MAIAKWDWGSTNHTGLHTDKAYGNSGKAGYIEGYDDGPIYFNASAEQVAAAYAAFCGRGRTDAVSIKVWNDLIDKIICVQRAWEISPDLGGWNVDPYLNMAEPDLANNVRGRAMTATLFNWAADANVVVGTWPWETELGRKLRKRDPCKGSYFLALVDRLNHWIELAPMPFSASDAFWMSGRCGAAEIPSVPMNLWRGFGLWVAAGLWDAPAVKLPHGGVIRLLAELPLDPGVPSIPFGSQFNFFDFGYHAAAVLPDGAVLAWPGGRFGTWYAFTAFDAPAIPALYTGRFGTQHGFLAGSADTAALTEWAGRFGTAAAIAITIQDNNELPESGGGFGTVGTFTQGGAAADGAAMGGRLPGFGGTFEIADAGTAAKEFAGRITSAYQFTPETICTVPLAIAGKFGLYGQFAPKAIPGAGMQGDAGISLSADGESNGSREHELGNGMLYAEIAANAQPAKDAAVYGAGDAETSFAANAAGTADKGQPVEAEAGAAQAASGAAAVLPGNAAEADAKTGMLAGGGMTVLAGNTAEGGTAVAVTTTGAAAVQHGETAGGDANYTALAVGCATVRHGAAAAGDSEIAQAASGAAAVLPGNAAEADAKTGMLAGGVLGRQVGHPAECGDAEKVTANGELMGAMRSDAICADTDFSAATDAAMDAAGGMRPLETAAKTAATVNGTLAVSRQAAAEAGERNTVYADGKAESAESFEIGGGTASATAQAVAGGEAVPTTELDGAAAMVNTDVTGTLDTGHYEWTLESDEPDMTEAEAGAMLEIEYERKFVLDE